MNPPSGRVIIHARASTSFASVRAWFRDHRYRDKNAGLSPGGTGVGRFMIKATTRVKPAPAANDTVRKSGAPSVVQLHAFRAAPSAVDAHARKLLVLIAAGDQHAFEELYRLLSRKVYAFALRLTGNAESAEEVTVDAMYEVWRSADKFRGDAQVSTWVFGIARNKALMTLRNLPAAQHADIDDFSETLESGLPDSFSLLAQARDGELIRRCLQSLSASHRECLHLVYFEEMSMPEIAAMLGVPEGTVKSRLWHAKTQLASAGLRTRSRSDATPALSRESSVGSRNVQ